MQDERRRYFRIDDSLGVAYTPLRDTEINVVKIFIIQ